MQRTASERRRAKRKVNQRFLSAMMDMGIPTDKAELALSETGNVGVEVRGAPQPQGLRCRCVHACCALLSAVVGGGAAGTLPADACVPPGALLKRHYSGVRGGRWRQSGCSACRSTCWRSTWPATPPRPQGRPRHAPRTTASPCRGACPCR